jgi:flagellar basal-body rod modification protein FlgD
MDVNGYISPLYAGKQANVVKKGGDSNLGMDDFLKLLAAQLANQDMMNPSQDTDFIAQMAQFSSLQSMDAMAKMTSFNQSTSLVGKYVVVATYERGKLVKAEGIVEKVNLFGYEPTIVVNGKEYTYANVMEIKNASEVKPNSPTALKNEIIAAQENKTSAKVSENGSDIHHTEKWVTQEQMNAYEMAIEKAQATMDKASITEKEIALAIAELALATETFNTAKKDGTYGLEQSIPEVEGGE